MWKILDNIEGFFSSFFLGLMTIVIIIQVIFRYFISYSLAWPEELGRYLFIASIYIGASYVEQKERHLSITILRTNGGEWCKKYLVLVVQCITIAFSLLMTVWGINMVVFMHGTGQLAPAIEVPMYVVYMVIPLGMASMAIRATINLVKYARAID